MVLLLIFCKENVNDFWFKLLFFDHLTKSSCECSKPMITQNRHFSKLIYESHASVFMQGKEGFNFIYSFSVSVSLQPLYLTVWIKERDGKEISSCSILLYACGVFGLTSFIFSLQVLFRYCHYTQLYGWKGRVKFNLSCVCECVITIL